MIARKHRFKGHNSVGRVRGTVTRSPLLQIVNSVNYKRTDYRVAVVVSKKVSKSAVVRNRIRRRIYESVRTSKILDGQNRDVVVIVRDVIIATMEFNKFNSMFTDNLRKSMQLKPKSAPR